MLTEDIEPCNIKLFSRNNLLDKRIFKVELLGSVVIDTACTETLCGQKWLDHYMSGLKSAEIKKLGTH